MKDQVEVMTDQDRIDRLESRLNAALDVLTDIEWCGIGVSCPSCGASDVHSDGCELSAALNDEPEDEPEEHQDPEDCEPIHGEGDEV